MCARGDFLKKSPHGRMWHAWSTGHAREVQRSALFCKKKSAQTSSHLHLTVLATIPKGRLLSPFFSSRRHSRMAKKSGPSDDATAQPHDALGQGLDRQDTLRGRERQLSTDLSQVSAIFGEYRFVFTDFRPPKLGLKLAHSLALSSRIARLFTSFVLSAFLS